MNKVNISKEENLQADEVNKVSLTKEVDGEVVTEETIEVVNEEESVSEKLNRASDSLNEKVEEFTNQANDMLNEAGQSLSESIDSINNGMQDFIDGVENKTNQWNEQNKIGKEALKLEPALAAIISVLVVGLGQMINGQLWKGLTLLGIGVIGFPLLVIVTCGLGAFILPLLAPALIAVAAVDAYKCAKRLEQGQQLGQFEFHIFD